jgi:hypothetical protein
MKIAPPKDAAKMRVQTDSRKKPPGYAIRLLDAETIEVDWVLSPDIRRSKFATSGQFTFDGALWFFLANRFVDSNDVGVNLVRGKSVHPEIVVSRNLSFVDASLLPIKNQKFAKAFKADYQVLAGSTSATKENTTSLLAFKDSS